MISQTILRSIKKEIDENGWWELCSDDQDSGTYKPAIIKAKKRGYVEIAICKPYGGGKHFAIRKGSGTWHTKGLDIDQAMSIAPSYGNSISNVVESMVEGDPSAWNLRKNIR